MRTRTILMTAIGVSLLAVPGMADDSSKSGEAGTTEVPLAPAVEQSSFAARTYQRGALKITVESPRMIMRGPMFPWGMLFDDGSILIIASSVEEGGPPAYVRSTDRGETWRPFVPPPGYCIPNVQLADGTALNCSSAPP